MLFGKELPVKLQSVKSSFKLKESDSDFVKAQTMFGQGETLISPMPAAILVSAIANGGTAMKPRLVESVQNDAG